MVRALLLGALFSIALTAIPQTDIAATPAPQPVAHAAAGAPRGMLALIDHATAGTGNYGQLLLAGCAWASWVSNCANLGVYGNGSSFDDNGCGTPNGCTFGSEFQCNELGQRYAYYAWGEPAQWNGYGGDQGSAYQMWAAGPHLPVPLTQFADGAGMPPQVGDLMIFNQGWLGSYWDGAGHVAIVSAVNEAQGYVEVVEQNATPTGTDRFALSGSTVTANGYTPIIGWLRPMSLGGPLNLTQTLPGEGTVGSAPTALVTSDGVPRALWRGTNGDLDEGDYVDGRWTGDLDWSQLGAYPAGAALASAPVVRATGSSTLTAVWAGVDGHIWQASSQSGVPGAATDVTATLGGTAPSFAASPPSFSYNLGQELVFWQGRDDSLWEAWADGPNWAGLINLSNMLPAVGGSGLASNPTLLIAPGGYQQLVFWQGADGHLWQDWWTAGIGWQGPVDWSSYLAAPTAAALASAPTVLFTRDQSQQLVYWRGANGDLWEAWWGGGRWLGPVDWSAHLGAPSAAVLASAPTVAVTPNGAQQLVFWQGGNGHLWEAWFSSSGWSGPLDISASASAPSSAAMASPPTLAFFNQGSQQLLFWRSGANNLYQAWFGASWHGANLSGAMLEAASAPVIVLGAGQQLVFWRSTAGHLVEAWYQTAWNGPLDLSQANDFPAGAGVTSQPSVVAVSGAQLAAWQGADGDVWSSWYLSGRWNGPVDVRTALGLPAAADAGGAPALVAGPGGTAVVAWAGSDGDVWTAQFTGSGWSAGTDAVPGAGAAGEGPASSVAAAWVPGQTEPLLAWAASGGNLWVAMPAGTAWSAPADLSTQLQAPAGSALSGAPSAMYSFGQQLVFWRGADGDVWEAWYGNGSWAGPADISSLLAGSASTAAAAAPAISVSSTGNQYLYWKGGSGQLNEAWYSGGSWLGPWNWTATLAAPGATVASGPAVALSGIQTLAFWTDPGGQVWEAWENGSA